MAVEVDPPSSPNTEISDIAESPTTTPLSDITAPVSGVVGETLLSGDNSPPSSFLLNSGQNQTFSDVLFTSLSDLPSEANLKTESNGVHIERAITLLETVRGGQSEENNELPRLSRSEKQEIAQDLTPVAQPEREILSPDKKEKSSFPGSQIFKKVNGRIVIRRLKKKRLNKTHPSSVMSVVSVL